VQRAIRAIRKETPKLLVVTDVCNCEYTSPGTAATSKTATWITTPRSNGWPNPRFPRARRADIVAPSDMMDGRVWAIRQALDANGSIRPRSSPTRQVRFGLLRAVPRGRRIGSSVRRPPQLPDGPANGREAMREIELDIEEGADIIMVKPAMPYLDLISQARQRFDVPIAAYR